MLQLAHAAKVESILMMLHPARAQSGMYSCDDPAAHACMHGVECVLMMLHLAHAQSGMYSCDDPAGPCVGLNVSP